MSDYTDLCARLRRMSDMTTTNNDIRDVLRAADAIEAQAREIAELTERVTTLEAAAEEAGCWRMDA